MKEVLNIIILVLISILPAIFLLWFFEKQDKGEKEPKKLKNKVFLWGIISTIIAAAAEINMEAILPSMNAWVYLFIIAFITTAAIEEGLKFWIVKRVAYNHKKFNEIMDGITYTIIAGLGFAVLENLLYVLQRGIATGILRAVLAVPGHALFSGVMGYYIGKAKFEKTPWDARNLLWKGFGLAVLYHGLYDFFLLSESMLAFAVVPLMIFMAVHLRHLIKKARFEDKVDKKKPTPLNFKRGLKIISATIFVMAGVMSLVGTWLLIDQKEADYTYIDLLYSAIFALILFVIGYFIIRKKKIDK